MSTETLPLDIDADIRERLDRVARQTGHSVSKLAGAVLRDFLDESDAYDAAIQEGIDDVEAGRVVELDVVKAEIDALLADLSTRR